ncbi:hypothetical protein Sru01_50130 [Sphaerisporangium rufum]|uniref:Uncharacterized protein n=1 Tax=Sphaerisporangium rufum TaxID=1381558 RepID=A0A919R5F3_9ACTN|nr:hypothetical protein Sru01_50130 [Sphaerisporangium rufum]
MPGARPRRCDGPDGRPGPPAKAPAARDPTGVPRSPDATPAGWNRVRHPAGARTRPALAPGRHRTGIASHRTAPASHIPRIRTGDPAWPALHAADLALYQSK